MEVRATVTIALCLPVALHVREGPVLVLGFSAPLGRSLVGSPCQGHGRRDPPAHVLHPVIAQH